MSDEDKTKNRRIYGRGFYDGIAHIERELKLNPSKLHQMEQGPTSVARKVMEKVPYDVPSKTQVVVSAMRAAGVAAELSIVQGCLASLVRQGLIKEPEPGYWVRVRAKPKLVQEQVADEKSTYHGMTLEVGVTPAQAPAAQTKERMDTLEKLAALAKQLRQQAEALNASAQAIEDAALEVETRLSAQSDEAKTLQALRKLLVS